MLHIHLANDTTLYSCSDKKPDCFYASFTSAPLHSTSFYQEFGDNRTDDAMRKRRQKNILGKCDHYILGGNYGKDDFILTASSLTYTSKNIPSDA